MADVIRFGRLHVGQSRGAIEAVRAVLNECDGRAFKTEGARLQFITRTLQAAGWTVSSRAMLLNRRYRQNHPINRRSA